jgi:hypothetical protein
MKNREHCVMKPCLILSIVLLLVPALVMAGSGSDACRQEERRLRAEEADRCSSVGYVFNPSACFNARKALQPYTKGKCLDLAAAEGVVEEPAPTAGAAPAAAVVPVPPPALRVMPAEPCDPAAEVAQLRREVAELRAEVKRLQDEVARLKGAQ